MDQRSQYLVQILEKIGAPLLAAVADVGARADKSVPKPKDQDELARMDAQRVAELLARSIQISIELGKSMDLASMPDQGEALRLALAALAGDVVASQYRALSRVPADADVRRAVTALEAVLTFSENFMPSQETIARLKELKAQGAPADAEQVLVQSLQALLPVVNAIGVFPFGQPEQKLIQDVADRLMSSARDLAQKMFPAADMDQRKVGELALMRALAEIYAECHRGEMNRLMGMSEELRMQQSLTLDPVWAAFETRAAMLEVLTASLIPASAGVAGGSGKAPAISQLPVQEEEQAAPPISQQPPSQAPPPVFQAPPQPPVFQVPPVQSTPPAAPPAAANPLSMFAKKPPESAPPPALPSAATETPPPSESPPSSPPSGGGPMSFFKKPE